MIKIKSYNNDDMKIDISDSLSDLSPTDIKRELDIITILLRECLYSSTLNSISIPLHNFEGKHFRDFQGDDSLVLKRNAPPSVK